MSAYADVMAVAAKQVLDRFRIVIKRPGEPEAEMADVYYPDDNERELVHQTVVVDADELGKQFLTDYKEGERVDFHTFDLRPTLANALFTFHIEKEGGYTFTAHVVYHDAGDTWTLLMNFLRVADSNRDMEKFPAGYKMSVDKTTGAVTQAEAVVDDVPDTEMWAEAGERLAATPLYCIDFLNCRNIVLVDEPRRPRPMARRIARTGIKMSEIHVLATGTTRKNMRVATTPVGAVPLHGVRGHKAEYGINGKGLLFGKYACTIWIPQHARGDRSLGKIEQSYRVSP